MSVPFGRDEPLAQSIAVEVAGVREAVDAELLVAELMKQPVGEVAAAAFRLDELPDRDVRPRAAYLLAAELKAGHDLADASLALELIAEFAVREVLDRGRELRRPRPEATDVARDRLWLAGLLVSRWIRAEAQRRADDEGRA